MAISNAIKFVKQVQEDKDLRDICNSSSSKLELLKDLGFSEYDFENAINMELFKCQSYESADQIQQIKFWFSLL